MRTRSALARSAALVAVAAPVLATLGAGPTACTIVNGLSVPTDGGAVASDGGTKSGTVAERILADDPLAFYALDERDGTVAVDATGHKANCSYSGSVSLGQPALAGAEGSSVHLSGGSIACGPNAFAFHGTNAFAIEGWFKPDGIDEGFQTAFARMHPDAPHAGYFGYFHLKSGPRFGFEVWVASKLACYLASVPLPCDVSAGADGGPGTASCSEPIHIVVTYDGKNLEGYINGALASSGACSALPTQDNVNFVWGGNSGPECPACALRATVDNLAVYGHILTRDQILRHEPTAR